MKNQLLEDIDDSKSRIPVSPVRRVQAVTPPHAQVSSAGAIPATAEAPARERAGVWRKRAPTAPPRHAAWTPRPVAPREAPPSPRPEPPRVEPRIVPDLASFSSREPDWSIPLQPEPPPWTERWGRKALGWSFGLGAVLAIAAGAAWMVHETQVESSLAVVADHTQAPSSPAAPLPEPQTAARPPLRLLPPEPPVTAPVAENPVEAEGAGSTSVAAAQGDGAQDGARPVDAAAPQPPVKKPAVKRAPERRVATAPVKRSRTETKKAAQKTARERERVLARAPTVPVRSVPADQPDPESPLAETLRMCRAAGYHATACLKRGCEATRFGLVCRG